MADTIRTEADLLNNIFPDNQAEGSITAQDLRDLTASARFLQPLGWEFRFDSEYTTSNRRTLVDDTDVQLTFTDFPNEDLRYPSTFPEIWAGDIPVPPQTLPQRLSIPTFINSFGVIRVSFFGEYTGNPNPLPHLDFIIDVGDDPVALGGSTSNVIYSATKTFAKSADDPQGFNFIVPLFGGNDFVANGAAFIVKAHEANVDIWDLTLTAAAIMVTNPAGEG